MKYGLHQRVKTFLKSRYALFIVSAMFYYILKKINDWHIKLFSHLAWIFVLLMVLTILIQVFFRYVLNNALAWPEEMARALMIWMIALVAGFAYRHGHFVAINMIPDALPKKASKILSIFFYSLAFIVLCVLVYYSIDFFQRGFRTRAASFQLARAWIYLSMPVCFISMFLVNLELLITSFKSKNSRL